MRIILHIGQSKTGTSSIQSFLTKHGAQLLQSGVLYPYPKVNGLGIELGSHNALADALAQKIRYPGLSDKDYFAQFFESAERHKCHTMILSGEHFFGGQPRLWAVNSVNEYEIGYQKKLERLSIFLANHNTEIIIFLRPQADWLASIITQNITHGPISGRDTKYDADREQYKLSKPVLMYSKRLKWWRDIITPEKFSVIPYVRQNLHGGNSISEFLHRCNLGEFDRKEAAHIEVNKTITREYIEVKKILNKSQRSKAQERTIVDCLRKLSLNSEFGSNYRVDEGVMEDLAEFVQEDNKRISREFLNGEVKFSCIGNYKGSEIPEISKDDVERALQSFEQEYSGLTYRAKHAGYSVRNLIRRHAMPVHGIFHQLKRLKRRIANFKE